MNGELSHDADTDSILPAFSGSIDPALLDALTDIAEAGFDYFVNAGLLDEVPIIKTIIGLGKTASSIHEANTMRQMASFLKELLSSNLDSERLEEHKRMLSGDPKFAAKALGFVMTMIDCNADTARSEMHGRLYRAFIYAELGWDEFVDMCEVVSRCMVSDMTILKALCRGETSEVCVENGYRIDRLVGLGLVSRAINNSVEEGDLKLSLDTLSMTPFGLRFCQLALDG